MTADKVRVGVVGLGYWGPNLARNFDRLPGAELAYCCDLDQANLEKARSLYPNTTVTDDYAQLLADDALDAIVVATSVPTHYKLGKLAIEAGKHTFIEKPIALKAADAQDLLDTAEEYGVKLMVGHLLEYHPAVAKMKELIDSGELGKVFYAYANRLNLGKVRTDENALWSFGPHDISVLNYLTGDEPVEVSARGECYLQDDVEDVVFGYIKYKSGVVGHLHVSWLDPHKSRKITVVGERRWSSSTTWSPSARSPSTTRARPPRAPSSRPTASSSPCTSATSTSRRSATTSRCASRRSTSSTASTTTSTPRSDGRDALNVVKVLDAMEVSLREGGRPVKTSEL